MLAVSEWWTVGSDLAVAAGTIGLAWFTWRLARQTRTLAVETGEDVRAGARPVLLDAAQGRPPTSFSKKDRTLARCSLTSSMRVTDPRSTHSPMCRPLPPTRRGRRTLRSSGTFPPARRQRCVSVAYLDRREWKRCALPVAANDIWLQQSGQPHALLRGPSLRSGA